MNAVANENWTYSWSFASLACKPLHHPRHPCACAYATAYLLQMFLFVDMISMEVNNENYSDNIKKNWKKRNPKILH